MLNGKKLSQKENIADVLTNDGKRELLIECGSKEEFSALVEIVKKFYQDNNYQGIEIELAD